MTNKSLEANESSIFALLRATEQQLIAALDLDKAEATLESSCLLAFTLNKNRSYLVAWPEQVLSAETLDVFQALLMRRLSGEPLAYLTQQKEFWSLPFKVNEVTLIPRPETELLVEQAIARLPQQKACQVLELGTGSGAISVAIAAERQATHLLAVDKSLAALCCAKDNIESLGFDRQIQLLCADWFSALANVAAQSFDLVLANPPYLAEDDAALQGTIRFEPLSALVAAESGLADLKYLIQSAGEYLRAGGWLLLEHGYQQGPVLRNLFIQYGFSQVASVRDLAGWERVTLGQKPILPLSNPHRD